MKDIKGTFNRLLLAWFEQNKRALPWRSSKNPYTIWLSEIILQQTRVAQGMPYYQRFIERFPDVHALAAAPEQEVLRLWQGLGYYSRARHLHHTSREIANKYSGKFPATYKELLNMKGIGDYTASAILSIAYGQPHAVLDGNVYRVLSRIAAMHDPINLPASKNVFKKKANEMLDEKQPGAWNEAIMELGAMVCLPQNPLCQECLVRSCCKAFEQGITGELPVKLPKREVSTRHLHYLYISNSKGLYLRQRGPGDIWQGLYDLPLAETADNHMPQEKHILAATGTKNAKLHLMSQIRHKLTHRNLHISFYKTELAGGEIIRADGIIFAPYNELNQYPLPKPIELFLKDNGIW